MHDGSHHRPGGGPGRAGEGTSPRGATARMYGEGLYRDDTFLIGAGNRGADAANLLVEIPLLLVALVLYRRGGLRGQLMLAGNVIVLRLLLHVDDVRHPVGAAVYSECLLRWRALPPAGQHRDAEKPRRGFRPDGGRGDEEGTAGDRFAVGGINDQIAHGTGILLPDPTDLPACGTVIRNLLDDPQERARMGAASHAHVRDNFVGDLHLLRYAEAFATLMTKIG